MVKRRVVKRFLPSVVHNLGVGATHLLKAHVDPQLSRRLSVLRDCVVKCVQYTWFFVLFSLPAEWLNCRAWKSEEVLLNLHKPTCYSLCKTSCTAAINGGRVMKRVISYIWAIEVQRERTREETRLEVELEYAWLEHVILCKSSQPCWHQWYTCLVALMDVSRYCFW